MKFIRKFNENQKNTSIEEIWLKNTGRDISQEEYSAIEEYHKENLNISDEMYSKLRGKIISIINSDYEDDYPYIENAAADECMKAFKAFLKKL